MEGITKTWTDAVSASGHRATRWRVRTARRFGHQPILSIAEPTRAPHRQSLDGVRKDYARKAKMLTPAEREAEVEAIAKALTSAPASTTTPDVKHAVEQFAAVVRKLPREQRVNAVADVIDAVAVMESDVRHETDRRAKERGEVSYLKTPKLLVRSNHHDY